MAWCHAGMVHGEFATSVAGSMMYDANNQLHRMSGKGGGFISMRSSPRLAEARNQLVDLFLTSEDFAEAEWLIMLDTDMVWEQHAIHQLVDTAETLGYELAGGLCFGGSDIKEKMFPTIYVQNGTTPKGYPMLEKCWDYPRDCVVECDATGAAFLLMSRGLLLRMVEKYRLKPDGKPNPYIWFEEAQWDGRPYGEDVAFCIKARGTGAKLMVHTGVRVGHLKARILDEARYDAWRAAHDDSGPGGDPAPEVAAAGG